MKFITFAIVVSILAPIVGRGGSIWRGGPFWSAMMNEFEVQVLVEQLNTLVGNAWCMLLAQNVEDTFTYHIPSIMLWIDV
jgi:hypothetical protein